jgi:hypothetical protein
MAQNRTRIIGSAIAGTGVAALIVAGMAFGMPDLSDPVDPALADSTRARAQLLGRTEAARPLLAQSSDAARAKAGEYQLPAQAVEPALPAQTVEPTLPAQAAAPAAVTPVAAAAPVAIPAAAEEPLSQASPAGYDEEEDDEDEKAGYAAGEEEDEEHEEEYEDEEGDDD